MVFCTGEANYDTRVVVCSYGIPPSNFSAMPECLINVHHLYQLPDFFVAVALAMPLDMLSLKLAMISRR